MSGGHGHQHHSGNLRVAFFLNVGFALFEVVGGILINSVAILSDAVHDLGDSISLGLAWFLEHYSERESNQQYTYGYHRYSLLGALINAVILVGGSLLILTQTVPRLLEPEPFDSPGMILIAIVGIAANGYAVLRLRGEEVMNANVVAWHLLEDVLGWIAVFIVGIVSLFVNLPILDPILAILITIYILFNAVRNLYGTLTLFLQASPENADVNALESCFQEIDGVQSTHHTHVWSLDGEHQVLTTHLLVRDGISVQQAAQIKAQARDILKNANLHLAHVTIEIEFDEDDCSMRDVTEA